MRIEVKLNESNYAIDVDGNCFTAVKFGINKAKGTETETQLGYFNKLSNCALRLCREEITQSSDTVTLKEFAFRVEAINKQLAEQLDTVLI